MTPEMLTMCAVGVAPRRIDTDQPPISHPAFRAFGLGLVHEDQDSPVWRTGSPWWSVSKPTSLRLKA